jgi:Family of unknown function (DUF5681)
MGEVSKMFAPLAWQRSKSPIPSMGGLRAENRRPTVQRTIEGRLLSMSTNRKAIRPALQRRAAMNDRKGIDATDYVGYGRPPKATQFGAGKRGNPKGRPKGSRTVGAILQDILSQKIAVTENGKTRRIPTLEAMFRRLVNCAIRRDAAALHAARHGDPHRSERPGVRRSPASILKGEFACAA